MTTSFKKLLVALAAATPLAGCATGPYYDGYNYGAPAYSYNDPYYYGPGPAYVGPSVGLGFSYSDSDYYRRDGRYYRDRDGRVYRDGRRVADPNSTGPGRWESDGRGGQFLAPPDKARDEREANSASPG